MDRLKAVFIAGLSITVLGAFSAVLALFCTGAILMAAAFGLGLYAGIIIGISIVILSTT